MPIAGGLARLDLNVARKRFVGVDGNPVEVLRNFAFSVADGEFVCLLGPSGCGKTTALRILLGLDRDYEGDVRVEGGRIGVVFQEPRLLPWRTVEQNVRLALPKEEAEKPLDALFSSLGLADMRSKFPGELSLGLARRAALARAFAIEPDILVMDEPFVSLDARTGETMRRLLLDLWAARPTTALMVTHAVGEAVELADRLVFLSPRPARVVGEYVIGAPRSRRDMAFRARAVADIRSRFPDAVGEG